MSAEIDGMESRIALGNVAAPANFSEPWVLLDDFAAPNETRGANTVSGLTTSNDLRLSGYQNQVIASAPGSAITLNLQNFVLSGHSTLSLLGDATSTFTFNVTNQFSLSQRARITLSGGIQWNHVFFNVLGDGRVVSLSGQTYLPGILTATNRIVSLRNWSTIYGRVLASRLIIRNAAQIITPPTLSP